MWIVVGSSLQRSQSTPQSDHAPVSPDVPSPNAPNQVSEPRRALPVEKVPPQNTISHYENETPLKTVVTHALDTILQAPVAGANNRNQERSKEISQSAHNDNGSRQLVCSRSQPSSRFNVPNNSRQQSLNASASSLSSADKNIGLHDPDIAPDGPTDQESLSFQFDSLNLCSEYSLLKHDRDQECARQPQQGAHEHQQQVTEARELINREWVSSVGSSNTIEFLDVSSDGSGRANSGRASRFSCPQGSSQSPPLGSERSDSHGRSSNVPQSPLGSQAGSSSMGLSSIGSSYDSQQLSSASDHYHDPDPTTGGLNTECVSNPPSEQASLTGSSGQGALNQPYPPIINPRPDAAEEVYNGARPRTNGNQVITVPRNHVSFVPPEHERESRTRERDPHGRRDQNRVSSHREASHPRAGSLSPIGSGQRLSPSPLPRRRDAGKQLREYQRELAESGLAGNSCIICAPTGSGKTMTAGHICKEKRKLNRPRFKTLFIVCIR